MSCVGEDGHSLIYTYDVKAERTGITTLLNVWRLRDWCFRMCRRGNQA